MRVAIFVLASAVVLPVWLVRSRSRALVPLMAAIVAFAFSLVLLDRQLGYTSPIFAVTLMCCVLGISAVGRPFFRLRVPRAIYQLRTWECAGHVYRLLGVPRFGALLRDTPLPFLNSHVYLSPANAISAPCCVSFGLPRPPTSGLLLFWRLILSMVAGIGGSRHLPWSWRWRLRATSVRFFTYAAFVTESSAS